MIKRLISILFVLFTLVSFSAPAADPIGVGVAVKLEIKGPIGPATQEYVEHGFAKAAREEAALVILQLDTPGGLSTSMRGIIKTMLSSDTPVVAYVAPSGAHAASAGTYIMYAANIAAMAPGTNLGAATPVNLMGGDKSKKDKKPSAEKSKAMNDARAYIRSLAEMHGRNVGWADSAVTKAASLSAKEALKRKVIDVIAPTTQALLKKINGRMVTVDDRKIRLDTTHLTVVSYHPSWRANLLSVIANPSIAYIFLIIAFYGLFFEFAHPGFIVPGVLGGIALILALYGLQLLPINYVGLGLIILGFAFFIAEAFITSYGVLGIGGAICFIVGSIMLLDTEVVGFSIPWQLITGVSVVTIFFVLGLVQLVFRVRRRPAVSGDAVLIGQVGDVLVDRDNTWLRVNGELWKIANPDDLHQGDRVSVTSVKGLSVIVKKTNVEDQKS